MKDIENLSLELSTTETNYTNNEQKTEFKKPNLVDTLDGGYGWFVVLAGFMVIFLVFGSSYSYGVLITSYKNEKMGNPTILTLVGTLNIATVEIGSILTGRIDTYIGHHRSILIGGVLFSLGLLASSWATKPWHLLLTQGFIVGIGGSFSLIATVTAVMEWFEKKRGLAFGVALSGSGIGGLILAPTLQHLITTIGISWSLRLYSLVSIIIFSLSSLVIREPKGEIMSKPANLEFSIPKNIKFVLLMLGVATFGMGFMVPLLSIQGYGISLGISESQSALFISLINGASAVGRIAMGSIGDRFGAINVAGVSMFLTGCCILLIWSFAKNFITVTIFCLLYGFFTSGFACLPAVISVQLFGSQSISLMTSFMYLAMGIPDLIGAPLATFILESFSTSDTPNYLSLIIYGGTVSLLGSIIIFLLKLIHQSKGLFSKV